MLDRGRALLFVLLVVPSAAHAQSPTGELRDARYEHLVSGELGFYYRSASTVDIGLLQPGLFAQLTLARFGEGLVQLDVAWRAVGSFGSIAAFRAMNPYLGVRLGYEDRDGDVIVRVRGGVGGTAPLTNAYDDWVDGWWLPTPAGTPPNAGALTQLYAASTQGQYDLWLLAPLSAALVVRGDVELRHPLVVAGADAALAVLFELPPEGYGGATTPALQLGAFAGGRPVPELVLGLRLQVVGTFPSGRSAEGYTSLTPFVRGEIGPGFVEGRLLMNLDWPYGFAFDTGPGALHVWAVQLLGGATFD